jgi:hypothetical protein
MSNQDDKKKVKLTGAPQLTDMILGSLKPRVGKETTKWVAGLAEDAMDAAEQEARMQAVEMLTSSDQVPARPAQLGFAQFMDYLFDCFQQYEFEWNRSAPSVQMTVAVERPTTVVETLRSSLKGNETRQVFRGRISTQYWTLLIRGHETEIEGFILPIDQLISFASDPIHFTQFLQMRGEQTEDGDVRWFVDDVEITWDKIRAFGKQLFASLVHAAKTESAEGFVFSYHHKSAESDTASGAVAATQQKADYSFYDHNPAFDEMGYSVPGSQPAAAGGQKKQATEENTAATQPRMTKPSAAPPAVNAAPAAAARSGSAVEAALDALDKAFATELEALSAAGQAAFAKQDMTTVQTIFERTTKLKQLREQAASQVASWKAQLR